MNELNLGDAPVTIADVVSVAQGRPVAVTESGTARIRRGHEIVKERVASGEAAYGVNTGLGSARNQSVPPELVDVFQEQIIVSHAGSTGALMSRAEVRAVIVARVASMTSGASGASTQLVDGLVSLLNHNITPAVPEFGSVGAADLVQLAGIGNVLMGRGQVLDGSTTSATAAVFQAGGLEPTVFQPKDSLALIGANAGSLGVGCLVANTLRRQLSMIDTVAALTADALHANQSVFDDRVVSARPLKGQREAARRIRAALAEPETHAARNLPPASVSLQDPLSLRTIPQVHGAALDRLSAVEILLELEINSRTENPLIFVESGDIVSNGNFAALELTLAFESLRLALAHVGMLSERRIALLSKQLRNIAPIGEQLLNASWRTRYTVPLLLQNTASALVAELKQFATPISVMGTPVSDGLEDHSSMTYSSVQQTKTALAQLMTLLAIEALLATEVAETERVRLGVERDVVVRGAGTSALADRVIELIERSDPTTLTGSVVDAVVSYLTEELPADLFSGRSQQ